MKKTRRVQSSAVKAFWQNTIIDGWVITLAKKYREEIGMQKGGFDTTDDFLRLKTTIKAEIEQAEKASASIDGISTEKILDEARRTFNLMVEIADIFKNGGYEEKTDALSELGSNLTLKDKILNVRNKKLIEILENGLFEAMEINKAFEQ